MKTTLEGQSVITQEAYIERENRVHKRIPQKSAPWTVAECIEFAVEAIEIEAMLRGGGFSLQDRHATSEDVQEFRARIRTRLRQFLIACQVAELKESLRGGK